MLFLLASVALPLYRADLSTVSLCAMLFGMGIAMVFFAHPRVNLEITSAPIPVIKAEKLPKPVIDKSSRLSEHAYQQVSDFLAKSLS